MLRLHKTKKAQSLFILVCVLSLLLAGAIAVFNVLRFNSRVTVPVAQLKEHAQAASHGQLLAAQLEGNPLDEIEETVKAFHDLVRNYQQLHTSLSENTSELASVAGQMFGTAREQEVMATCLHLWRGLRAPGHPGPLRRFRLVAEYGATWPGGKPYTTRVFEFVRGARVVVRAPARGSVTLRIRLEDEDGQAIDYVASARPAEAGACELRVPYATEGGASRFRASGPGEVIWSDGSAERGARVTIPESAVQTGAIVRCNLL